MQFNRILGLIFKHFKLSIMYIYLLIFDVIVFSNNPDIKLLFNSPLSGIIIPDYYHIAL